MCKEREYKWLDTVSNAFSVPVPGTKAIESNNSVAFLVLPQLYTNPHPK